MQAGQAEKALEEAEEQLKRLGWAGIFFGGWLMGVNNGWIITIDND